ncbi:GAF and ANTAR domain-containing protein [soil metagenome]
MELPDEVRRNIDVVNRLLATQRTLPAKLEAVAVLLAVTVPDCASVSVALVVEGAAITGAASSELAIEADLVQYATGDGPCLEAAAAAKAVRIDVLEHDERWVHFAPGALRVGIESVLSVPLVSEEVVVGSINLYSQVPNGLGIEAERRVLPVAAYAAGLIARSPLFAASLDLVDGLVEAVEVRDLIARAMGVLRGVHGLDEADALAELRRRALAEDHSIGEVAGRILDEFGAAPGPGADGDPDR